MTIRPLTPELAEKARVELNEDPNRIAKDVQHIKDWLAKQPHIRARTDDQWLVAFLRGCKFSLERTKEKLDIFYSLHTLAPELFNVKVNDALFKEILDLGTYTILPKTATPTSPVVTVIRPGTYDPDKYKLYDIFSVSILLQNMLLIDNDNMTVAGVQTILDLEGVTMGHFLQMTPSVMKRMAVLSQDAAPVRMKGTHYINTPPGFETVFNAIKSLLNEKNRSRLYVHNKNYDEMYKFIPQEILPTEYGGKAGTFKEINEYWKKKVQHYNSWLEDGVKYGTDESKRPGKPKSAETLFGVEGSFRQLDFD
ncbi:alpha-tocopherol transfer protein-like [Bicyclus anynana]|uniref:Alpha-tocopherol transfer protein-like n=1 Tax=Bicyclus anynana TaxID=110368 RepID=A0A6J1P7E4_BICAN|nr:alpha-tocopherol transfer protein-like [Bicyclus anynana]